MTVTYDRIATNTLGSATDSVTFTLVFLQLIQI
jgi:hypothetical protein